VTSTDDRRDAAGDRAQLGYRYEGDALRYLALPLGGIGSGQIALCGDGALRQWQMVNQVNHLGFVPDSFFALRVSSTEPPTDVVRVLQSRENLAPRPGQTPLVNDNVIPDDQRTLLTRFPGVERTSFSGAYPFGHVTYEDATLPVEVSLEAWSPFVPLDATASGLPAITFTFRLWNRTATYVHGCLGAALQNAVGWDGVTPILGNRCSLYGGNTNRVRRQSDQVSIVMENPTLPLDHPSTGQMILTALPSTARPYEQWSTPDEFIRTIEGFHLDRQLDDPKMPESGYEYMAQRPHRNAPHPPIGPSALGETWNGGFLAPFRLAPAESTDLTFIIAWHFPNRYVNFDQFGPPRQYGTSRFWLGNAYSTRFSDAEQVVDYLVHHRSSLYDTSLAWTKGIVESSLPDWMAEALTVQGVPLRSPTCFQTADGKFFGFEGCLGASTTMWSGAYGGSCPLNCTHVWNYEQALSRLFPELERTMRETELEVMQAPEGYIPHRVYMPLYLPQIWDDVIGGPDDPALDGMLGTVLKVYREVRQGAGSSWLDRMWPGVKRLLTHITGRWDPDRDGVLAGKQPNTYDISFYGTNMFIGGLWLAALRAAEEMARLQQETELALELHDTFERGSSAYDRSLWNGEYYVQVLGSDEPDEFQYGDGCLSDQLLGQWWAHQLDLGYILPADHVRQALRSIVRYNFRHDFHGFEHEYRVFADRDDAGLLVCTWPLGGRPAVPVRYADEVWTGVEYQVGAHCIMEGQVETGCLVLEALRARYAGTRRNPYNEIECGDHYARSLAGWSVLEAMSGFRYNAVDDTLSFAPATADGAFRIPFIAASGWGTYEQTGHHPWSRIELSCSYGAVHMQQINLPPASTGSLVVSMDDHRIDSAIEPYQDGVRVAFHGPLVLPAGSRLEITIQ
jgi:non-lysosomal glucosylceramidase